jgi:hypothetical protein
MMLFAFMGIATVTLIAWAGSWRNLSFTRR